MGKVEEEEEEGSGGSTTGVLGRAGVGVGVEVADDAVDEPVMEGGMEEEAAVGVLGNGRRGFGVHVAGVCPSRFGFCCGSIDEDAGISRLFSF